MLDRWLFNTNKLKTQCKLCISRIKLMRNKKQLSVKQLLKEVGELLRQSKEDNAWIRVESAIHERQLLRAYDLLEVYLELLAVRVDLLAKIQAMPPDMMEAICSVVYASQRLAGDLAELPAIRKLLVSKYDRSYKDFAGSASSDLTYRDWHVNESLVGCLAVEAPHPQLKLDVLAEAAKTHEVPCDLAALAARVLPAGGSFWGKGGNGGGHTTGGGVGGHTAGGGAGGHMTGPANGAPAHPKQSPPSNADPWNGLRPAPADLARSWGAESSAPTQARAAQPGTPPKTAAAYSSAEEAAAAAQRYSVLAQEAAEEAARLSRAGGGGSAREGDTWELLGRAEAPAARDEEAEDGEDGGEAEAAAPAAEPSRGRFVPRTKSQVQRQFDAAEGCPVKTKQADGEESTEPSAPSAPADLPGGRAPPACAPATELDPVQNHPDSASAPARTPDDLDELTKRFEALKRR